MPRRERPAEAERSEHWIREAVNKHSDALNSLVSKLFKWDSLEQIEWLSPVASDKYAEYFDQEFLDKLHVPDLKVPLNDFWPPSGPRWDGLGRTLTKKFILVEAKAYVEEAVDFGSRAADPQSRDRIKRALSQAKTAFRASKDAKWDLDMPFYQYANRLAHLYFMRGLNDLDAYLLFLYFVDAKDVPTPPGPSDKQEWKGAERLIKKCLGLPVAHPFSRYFGTLTWSVPEMKG